MRGPIAFDLIARRLKPWLIGKDPDRIEDLWQSAHFRTYWRNGPVLNNAEAGYDWSTYPELLEQAGISWKIYQDVGVGLIEKPN